MKILLVDDEADVAQTCSRFLAETGHDCVTAPGEKRVIAAVVPPQNSESVEIARICGGLRVVSAALRDGHPWPRSEENCAV
jgi:hypothetical protein